jgi:hypothetical protein
MAYGKTRRNETGSTIARELGGTRFLDGFILPVAVA